VSSFSDKPTSRQDDAPARRCADTPARPSPNNPRVNRAVLNRDSKFYILDWDNNILHMPTRIHLEKRGPGGVWQPHSVSTAMFSVVRNDTENYRPPNGDWKQAFAEFQDPADLSENRFLRDAAEAIERALKNPETAAPSFNTFRRTLAEGRLFAIVTARGHSSETLKKGVRLFIDRVLTPAERDEMMASLRGYRACYDGVETFGTDEEELAYYLALNRYHAVTSPAFEARVAELFPGAVGQEERKQFAIHDFVRHVIRILERTGALGKPVSVGFSDDDPGNIHAVTSYISTELKNRFPNVKFVVYDTSAPHIEGGRKITVSGQLDLGL